MDSELIKQSPFHLVDDTNYNLQNTTPDLLKFQLQENYRTKLTQLKQEQQPGLNILNSQFLDSSFNDHLQKKLESGEVKVDCELSHSDSLPSLQPDEGDVELESYLNGNTKNYVNLRILIENSVFDSSKVSPKEILSLNGLNLLKKELKDKEGDLEYLLQKLLLTQELVSDSSLFDSLDVDMQNKLLKSCHLLSTQLLQSQQELQSLQQALYNHNFACLILGYVDDVKMSLDAKSTTTDDLDSLFSKIVNISIKKNIALPEPLDDKVQWLEICLDKLIDDDEEDTTLVNRGTESAGSAKSVNKSAGELVPSSSRALRTALNDLRFSHQYLIKEYDHSRTASQKLINEYRKQITQLQEKAPETITPISYDSVESKDREIAKLKKELSNLKIDKLGSKALVSPRYDNFNTSFNIDQSPVNDLYDDESNSSSSNLSTARSQGMSNGILRKEFKKIVGDIQDQYEVELNEERIKRRQLQEELERLRKS